MSHTEIITIKNPSRKLEEQIRWIGAQKYLRQKKLVAEDCPTAKVIMA